MDILQLKFLPEFVLSLLFVSEVLLQELHDLVVVFGVEHLLELVHGVAHVVTNLDGLVARLHLHPPPELQDHLALLVRTLVLLAPLLVLLDVLEQYQFLTELARDFQNLDEFSQDVGGGSDPQLSRTLVGAVFVPLVDAILAE